MQSFESRATSYNAKNASILARCAESVYKNETEIQEEISGWDVNNFQFISRDETQCFIMSTDSTTIVSFRGTEINPKDIISDINALQRPSFGGEVHEGFLNAFDDVKAEVLRVVAEELQNNNRTLWVTGHSLGGALATVATAEFLENKLNVQGVYTFGQPRVGNKTFARRYDSNLPERHFRFVNNNDIVTRVPPEKICIKDINLEYHHVGKEVLIKADKSIVVDPSSFTKTFDRVRGRVEAAVDGDYTDGISDHSMSNYVEALA